MSEVKKLTELFPDLKIETDKTNEAIVWIRNSKELFSVISKLKHENDFKLNYLSDLTAYDNIDGIDGPKRFVLVYQLLSLETKVRVRLKMLANEDESGENAVTTLSNHYSAANWMEREVYDMYGIIFHGHPDLRRILMDERFVGFPLRKEYDIKDRQPFPDNMKINLERRSVPLKGNN